MNDDVPVIAKVLDKAHAQGILVFASASNQGANDSIAFPARLRNVFCIGAADGKGSPAAFNHRFLGWKSTAV